MTLSASVDVNDDPVRRRHSFCKKWTCQNLNERSSSIPKAWSLTRVHLLVTVISVILNLLSRPYSRYIPLNYNFHKGGTSTLGHIADCTEGKNTLSNNILRKWKPVNKLPTQINYKLLQINDYKTIFGKQAISNSIVVAYIQFSYNLPTHRLIELV